MIVCFRYQLEQRAAARGYKWQAVEPCIVSSDGDKITVDETHEAYPRARPGLGDIVASGLLAVGITKELVSAIVGRNCGCKERQEALNRLGRKFGIG